MDQNSVQSPDFKEFTKFPLFVYKTLFFDFEPKKKNPSIEESFKYFFKVNFMRLGLIIIMTSDILLFMYIFIDANTFDEIFKSMINAVGVIVALVKTATTFWNRQTIRIIMQELQNFFDRRSAYSSAYNVQAYLTSYLRFVKIYGVLFLALFIQPVVVPILMYLFNGSMILNVDYWFPFDPLQPSTYPFAQLWISTAAYVTIINTLAAETLLYAMLSVLVMEFDILKMNFLTFKDVPKNQRSMEFGNLIKRHNKLFDLCDKLQNIYKFSFLCTFDITSLCMCLAAFRLSVSTDHVEDYSYFIPYLGVMGGQVLLLCVFCQKLTDSSLAVSKGVYDIGWTDIDDIALKKQLIFVILRSNKPKQLTAMNFFDISLEAFTSVSFFLCEST